MKWTFACEAKLVLFVGAVVAELGQEGLDTGWTRVEAHDEYEYVAASLRNSVRFLEPVAAVAAGAARWFPIHCEPSYMTDTLTDQGGAPLGGADHCAV